MSSKMSIGEAAEHIGVSKDTLRRWEKKGKITPERSPTNRRYYTKELLDNCLKKPSDRSKTETAIISKRQNLSLKLVFYTLGAVMLAVVIGLVTIILL